MAAQDNLQPAQFAVHAGKYAIQREDKYVPTVTARRLNKEGEPGNRVGYITYSPHSGEIGKAYVSGPHRRKGVASAMLDYARAQDPDRNVHHSHALSDDGSAWSKAKP